MSVGASRDLVEPVQERVQADERQAVQHPNTDSEQEAEISDSGNG